MRIFVLGVILFFSMSCRSGENPLWDEANAAYQAGDYASAAALYDSLENRGMVSAKLYFNKGNALFKMGKLGPAILYYAKAQRLSPADEDIRHNLEVASAHTRNRIEPVPELFLKRWGRGLGTILSVDGWAVLSLVMLGLGLAGGLLFLLPFSRGVRRGGFYGGVGALVCFAVAFFYAQSGYGEVSRPTQGVVVRSQAAVKSSPDGGGTDLFVLYEGDFVRVRDRLGEWSEVTVADGNRGWVRSDVFELVD